MADSILHGHGVLTRLPPVPLRSSGLRRTVGLDGLSCSREATHSLNHLYCQSLVWVIDMFSLFILAKPICMNSLCYKCIFSKTIKTQFKTSVDPFSGDEYLAREIQLVNLGFFRCFDFPLKLVSYDEIKGILCLAMVCSIVSKSWNVPYFGPRLLLGLIKWLFPNQKWD